MVRSQSTIKNVELLKEVVKNFEEVTLEKEDIQGANRRRLVDIIIANRDIDELLTTLDTLGLDHGLLNKDMLEVIHSVSNDVLYGVKNMYFRTQSKILPEVFLAATVSFLNQNATKEVLIGFLKKTIETESLPEEKYKEAKEAEVATEVANEESESNLEEETMENILNENVNQNEDELLKLKETVKEAMDTILDDLKSVAGDDFVEPQPVKKRSLWKSFAIGAAIGVVVGAGIYMYKTYFKDNE